MDNNLNDQITENSEGEEKSPSSYTDPNAGYTEAEPQAKNDNSVPKEAADDNLKQEEKSHPAYTYGEMPKSENGSGYGQSAPDGSACHSGTSDGTYENNTYNGNSYYNGTNQSGAYTNGYSDNQNPKTKSEYILDLKFSLQNIYATKLDKMNDISLTA